MVVPGSAAPSQSPSSASAADEDAYSEDGASRFLDDELDDEDEVEGMSVLGGSEGSAMGTPRSSLRRGVKMEGSVMSSEDGRMSIDR